MRRILSLLLAFVLFFALCSCSASDLSSVRSNGKLVVGVTEYAPMDYRDEDGNWIGFDAELATLAAERLGVKVEFKIINWDEKTDKLKSKEIDCIWNGYTVNDHDKVDFSEPYAKNSPVLVVKNDKASDLNSPDKLDGLKVAFEKGSSSEIIVDGFNSNIEKVSFDLQKEALQAVASGESDACVVDKTIFDSLVHSELTATYTFNSENFAVGFRSGSDLTDEINSFLKSLKEDGTLSRLAEKYKVELM